MSKSPEAPINPKMLIWARKRAGLDLDELARKMNVPESKIFDWESGCSRPTIKQAELFAQKTYVYSGDLYLKTPPEDIVSIPDLRTIKGEKPNNMSVNFLDTFEMISTRQDWYREYLIDIGADSLPFVGKYKLNSHYKVVAQDITDALKLNSRVRESCKNHESLFAYIRKAAESLGILVMRTGIVGNNSYRKLDVKEFRGFAIVDEYAPLIFINNQDAKTAQLFTLAHELAHIWLGQSGISNPKLGHKNPTHVDVESFCNEIAAEVLLPENLLLLDWDRQDSIQNNFNYISYKYKVSQLVVGRRAYDLNLVSYEEYKNLYRLQTKKKKPPKEKGQNNVRIPQTVLVMARNGRVFTQMVVEAALSGEMTLSNACDLLGTKVQTIKAIDKVVRTKRVSA